jgi:hypothetical protein
VSHKLKKVSGLGDKQFAVLADKADGLFQRARLACEHIQKPSAGSCPIERFNVVVSYDHGERKNLLYDMYSFISGETMRKDSAEIRYQRVLFYPYASRFVVRFWRPLFLYSINLYY